MTFIIMALALLGVLLCIGITIAAFFAAVASWVEDWFEDTGKAVAFSVTCVVGAVLALAGMFWIITAVEPDEPCIRQETTVQYDPATKTTRPVTYCAERGEWADA